jgi:D-3-phosphoglycerate dehydrogenase / 2-oxoglutarate reductase
MKTVVLITGNIHTQAIVKLKEQENLEVLYYPDSDLKKIYQQLSTAHILVTRSETTISKEVIDKAPFLRTIIRAAVGVANIDINYASTRGILVTNTPGKNTNSAAEHTFALLLGMLRNIPQAHNSIKNKSWDRHKFCGRELRNLSLGIIGLGNVGHRVAHFAHAFEMKVFAFDPYVSPKKFIKHKVIPCENLRYLNQECDIISLHLPLNEKTKKIINKEFIFKMKPGSFLLNAARGGLICEDSLLDALNSDKLSGVAIDTWNNEPTPNLQLTKHPKVWCSPHIGASTHEAQKFIGLSVVEQVNKVIQGGIADHPVNVSYTVPSEDKLIWQYALLGEKLGAFVAQALDFNPSSLTIEYNGSLSKNTTKMIRVSILKGYCEKIIDKYISHVNAEECFSSLEIKVEEKNVEQKFIYKSSLTLKVQSALKELFTISGTVLEENILRLSTINNFTFEVPASGNFLVIENTDNPGVIGEIGSVLGNNKINIDSFSLSRNQPNGLAMSLIKTDSEINDKLIKLIKQSKYINKIKKIII